jgi:hypothetical protein
MSTRLQKINQESASEEGRGQKKSALCLQGRSPNRLFFSDLFFLSFS